jgi:hypothetical protein
MSQTLTKQKLVIELSPGDILDEILKGDSLARYLVVGREIFDHPKYQFGGREYNRVTYELFLMWCDKTYETERYRPGIYWTIDEEDLLFNREDWRVTFKSGLSWEDK